MELTKDQENTIRAADKLQENSSLESYVAPKITVEIPTNFVVRARDYHEFDIIRDYLDVCLGLECEFEEVGYQKISGEAVYQKISCEAVFYIGPKPEELIKKIKDTYR